MLSLPLEREDFLDELTYGLILILFGLGIFLFKKAGQKTDWLGVILYLLHPLLLVLIYFILSLFTPNPLIALTNGALILMLMLNSSLWPLAAIIHSVKWIGKDEKKSKKLYLWFLGLSFLPTLSISLMNYFDPYFISHLFEYIEVLTIDAFIGIIIFWALMGPIVFPLLSLLSARLVIRKNKENLEFRKLLLKALLILLILSPIYLHSWYFVVIHNLP